MLYLIKTKHFFNIFIYYNILNLLISITLIPHAVFGGSNRNEKRCLLRFSCVKKVCYADLIVLRQCLLLP